MWASNITAGCEHWTGFGHCPYCGQSYHQTVTWTPIWTYKSYSYSSYADIQLGLKMERFKELAEHLRARRQFLYHVQEWVWRRRRRYPVSVRDVLFEPRSMDRRLSCVPRSGRPRQRVVGLNFRKASQ